MDINLAHLHLLVNHAPTIGTSIAIAMFVVSLLWKSEDLKRASYVLFLLIALVAIPTYLSGNAALMAIEDMDGVSQPAAEAHQSWALFALALMELTGAVAWFGLWQHRRIGRLTTGNLAAVLVLSVVTLGVMGNAANIGGEIRHPEIVADGAGDPSAISFLTGTSVGAFVLDDPWVWPTSETLHFVGLSLLFGVVLLVDLRMLGVIRNVSFSALHRLLPWAVLGFALNTFTGMLFFIASPGQYATNPVFHWKIAFVMIAGINALYFTLFDETWALKPNDEAPATAKAVAVSAVVLWVGIIYCGSMLPFIGNAF